ncbi:hypothetical protein HID58_087965, partial [Brassica napus]
APVSKSPVAVYFSDVSPRPAESELPFRLVHFWEAINIAKGGTFIGLELLLIDQQEKVCSSRVITVLDWLKISGSAADRGFEVVSSEIVGFTVVVA